ncbi:MAG: RNA methyltransferase [Mariprofundaceae bacterium]
MSEYGFEAEPNARFSVALVHHPVLDRRGEPATTAVTPLDVHDFARCCAFYGAGRVYVVHPSAAMRGLVSDMLRYYLDGPGGARNPDRRRILARVRCVACLEEAVADGPHALWATSASPPEGAVRSTALCDMPGRHLLAFGTGGGLDAARMPAPRGWLSPIEGDGMVRRLPVRAALAIVLDRLFGSR